MNGTNCNTDERGLLPYPVILAATKGDPEAMNIVMQHYQSYIAHLSIRKIRDERGNTYYGVDEDLRERLQSKLMQISKREAFNPFPLCVNLPCLLLDKESGAS